MLSHLRLTRSSQVVLKKGKKLDLSKNQITVLPVSLVKNGKLSEIGKNWFYEIISVFMKQVKMFMTVCWLLSLGPWVELIDMAEVEILFN